MKFQVGRTYRSQQQYTVTEVIPPQPGTIGEINERRSPGSGTAIRTVSPDGIECEFYADELAALIAGQDPFYA